MDEGKVQSFRFDAKTFKKLEVIREYHQNLINQTSQLIKSNSSSLSRGAVLRSLIEQEYFRMVRDGIIEDKELI